MSSDAPDEHRAGPPLRRAQRTRLEAYAATGDRALRDRLVEEHLPLAEHLARRFTNRGVPLDDLVQVASIGLVNAIERFDPDRGLEFSTFATPTIIGELKRHFRDKGWAVRVPRRVQELHIQINTVMGELTQRLGRSPTVSELGREVGASDEEVLEAVEAANAYRSASIDAPVRSGDGLPDGSDLASQLGVEDPHLSASQRRMEVEELLANLPPREQLMVRLRYFEGMSQQQIAARLGISQMHVSRLLGRSLGVLRSQLARDER